MKEEIEPEVFVPKPPAKEPRAVHCLEACTLQIYTNQSPMNVSAKPGQKFPIASVVPASIEAAGAAVELL